MIGKYLLLTALLMLAGCQKEESAGEKTAEILVCRANGFEVFRSAPQSFIVLSSRGGWVGYNMSYKQAYNESCTTQTVRVH